MKDKTIIIQEVETKLNDKETTVMGIGSAGWSRYKELMSENGTAYTTTSGSPEDDSDSIYWLAHGETTWEKRSERKTQDPKSVESALGEFKAILSTVKHPETMKNVYSQISKVYPIEIWDPNANNKFQQLIRVIEEQPDRRQQATSLFAKALVQTLSSYMADPVKNSFTGQPTNLSGYYFAQLLKNDQTFDLCFKNEDNNKYKELKTWVGYITLDTPGSVLQRTLDRCKRMIADTLQHNLSI